MVYTLQGNIDMLTEPFVLFFTLFVHVSVYWGVHLRPGLSLVHPCYSTCIANSNKSRFGQGLVLAEMHTV